VACSTKNGVFTDIAFFKRISLEKDRIISEAAAANGTEYQVRVVIIRSHFRLYYSCCFKNKYRYIFRRFSLRFFLTQIRQLMNMMCADIFNCCQV